MECECVWSSMSVRMWSKCNSVKNGDSSLHHHHHKHHAKQWPSGNMVSTSYVDIVKITYHYESSDVVFA